MGSITIGGKKVKDLTIGGKKVKSISVGGKVLSFFTKPMIVNLGVKNTTDNQILELTAVSAASGKIDCYDYTVKLFFDSPTTNNKFTSTIFIADVDNRIRTVKIPDAVDNNGNKIIFENTTDTSKVIIVANKLTTGHPPKPAIRAIIHGKQAYAIMDLQASILFTETTTPLKIYYSETAANKLTFTSALRTTPFAIPKSFAPNVNLLSN